MPNPFARREARKYRRASPRRRRRKPHRARASRKPHRATLRSSRTRSTQSNLVVVGRLGAPHGIRGELKCRPASFGPEAFAAGRSFALGREPGAATLVCTGVRTHHESLLLSFAGVATPEDARAFTNRELYAVAADVPLGDGEYFDRDLIDCELVDPAGTSLGRVIDVQHFPAQDCLVVGPQKAFVPLVKAFVKKIDLAARRIVVDLPEGLLEP